MIKKLNFIPSLHGFHFNNQFTTHVGVITTRGLCGGMVLAAFNYYRRGWPVPAHHQDTNDFDTPDGLPVEGGRLRNMILDLQIGSFASAAPFLYLDPNEEHHFNWSVGEFNLIKHHIDNNRFVLLGLRSGFATGHQTLVYGYDDSLQRVFMYDCNYPDMETVIDLNSTTQKLDHKNHTAGDVVNADRYLSYFVQLPLDANNPDLFTEYNRPTYTDLAISSGFTLSPAPAEGRRMRQQIQYTVRVMNFGECVSTFDHLHVYVRDPLGRNRDADFGLHDGASILNAGAEKTLTRTISSFGDMPGIWEIGVSYLSKEGHWIMVPNYLVPNTQNKIQFNLLSEAPVASTNWNVLGTGIVSDPATAINLDNRIEVFVRKNDNQIYKAVQRRVNVSNDFSQLELMPGSQRFDGNVGTILNQSNGLEIFVRGRDNALWHRWQNNPNVTSVNDWSGWTWRGGNLKSDPAVTMNQDKRLEVFAIHQDNRVYKIYHRVFGGWWSNWELMNSQIQFKGNLSAHTDANNRIHLVARGFDDAVWINFQVIPNGPYNGWISFGGVITGDPVLVKNSDGRLEVFARGTDGKLWHRWQLTPNGNWANWKLFQMNTAEPPVLKINGKVTGINHVNNHLELLITGSAFDVKSTHRIDAEPWWANWQNRNGSIVSNPAAAKNPNGQVDVFGIDAQGQLQHHFYSH